MLIRIELCLLTVEERLELLTLLLDSLATVAVTATTVRIRQWAQSWDIKDKLQEALTYDD